MTWTKRGGPAHSLAIFGDRLAALSADRQSVHVLDPSSREWRTIGSPATALVGGAWDLYAVAPVTGDLWRYDGQVWTRAGGPASQFVGICNSVYALNVDRSKVCRYDRYSGAWQEIGGKAEAIIGGGSKLYAAAPGNAAIWEYSRYQNTWQKIGGAGAMWVGVNDTVFGLSPDKNAVYRYDGTPDSWTKVGGPAASLIGGGSYLYAIHPGDQTVWRYRGQGQQWDVIGTAGTGYVAVGRTLYGMTPDKSTVAQFTDDNPETERLRDLLYAVGDSIEFGQRVMRGFLVKRVNGEVIAERNSDVCFQPLSTLKLLPYLHALTEVDAGKATLSRTAVSWVQPTVGDRGAMTDATCIAPAPFGTTSASAPLAAALPTMMWESHNRTLDAVMALYGSTAITGRGQQLGLRQTEMYPGCPQPNAPATPWANNISTLRDIGRIFEGVEAGSSLKKPATRHAFRTNMIVMNAAPGTSYSSPITGRTTGPFDTEFLRPLVEREAGPAKASVVPQFMEHMVLRGKGGSGGPAPDEIGMSDFLQVSLPFKQGGGIVMQDFLVGWFICQMRAVSMALQNAENGVLAVFRQEIHAAPIREALATW